MRVPWQRRLRTRTLVTVVLVVAADHLFFDRGLGVNTALLGALAALGLGLTAAPGLRRRVPAAHGALLAVTLLLLVGEPSPLSVALAATTLLWIAVESRQGLPATLREGVQDLFFSAARAPFQGFLDTARLMRAASRPGRPRGVTGALRRWALPFAMTGVFLLLFLAANALLAKWMRTSLEGLSEFLGNVPAARVALWFLVAGAAWALLRTRPLGALRDPFPASVGRLGVDPAFVTRSLVLFNGLFLLQNVLDVRYLWLGSALPEGMTYAQYAHRGAYPLVATALLAGAFALATFRPGADRAAFRTPRRLVLLFLAQNVFLTVCAVQRLLLYVEAYDLTRLRVAAAVWMVLVAIGLVLVVVRIVTDRPNRWLVAANVRTALAALLLSAAVNVDRIVADHNVAGCRELGGGGLPLDFAYLDLLGTDAYPALRRYAAAVKDPVLEEAAVTRATLLRATLEQQVADWRTWTVRRARLLEDGATRTGR